MLVVGGRLSHLRCDRWRDAAMTLVEFGGARPPAPQVSELAAGMTE
jgi:hypothetical protein